VTGTAHVYFSSRFRVLRPWRATLAQSSSGVQPEVSRHTAAGRKGGHGKQLASRRQSAAGHELLSMRAAPRVLWTALLQKYTIHGLTKQF
jgi:hypothetical protein